MRHNADAAGLCGLLRGHQDHWSGDYEFPRNGVELGVYRGDTSEVLLREFPQLTLHMVDEWTFYAKEHPYRKSGDGCSKLSNQKQSENMQTAYERTMFADDRRWIHGISTSDFLSPEVLAQDFVKTPLCFVFIDADHTYGAVKRDIQGSWPMIRAGGLLCGHDYGHPRDKSGIWGVSRAVNEFAALAGLSVQVHGNQIWSITKPTVPAG